MTSIGFLLHLVDSRIFKIRCIYIGGFGRRNDRSRFWGYCTSAQILLGLQKLHLQKILAKTDTSKPDASQEGV